MWEKFKKRWRSIVLTTLAALPGIGWGSDHLLAHWREFSDLKNGLSAKTEANAVAIQAIKGEQDKAAPKIEHLPILIDAMQRLEEQSRENGREIKENSVRLARIEGTLEAIKKDGVVAIERKVPELQR